MDRCSLEKRGRGSQIYFMEVEFPGADRYTPPVPFLAEVSKVILISLLGNLAWLTALPAGAVPTERLRVGHQTGSALGHAEGRVERGRLCAQAAVGLSDAQLGMTDADRRVLALGRRDLPAALAFIDAHVPADGRARAKWVLFYKLCQDDLSLLAKIPASLPAEAASVYSAHSAVESVCAYWVARDYRAIVRRVEVMEPGPLSTELRTVLARQLAKDHFAEGIALLAPLRPAQKPLSILAKVADSYGGKEMSELATWIQSVPPPQVQPLLTHTAITLQNRREVTKLVDLTAALPAALREQVLGILGSTLAAEEGGDLRGRIDALNLPPGEAERVLLGALAKVPVARVKELAEPLMQSPAAEIRRAAVAQVIPRLAGSERKGAIEWAMALPPELHPTAIQSLVATWPADNSASLLEWVDALPAGRDRDIALKDVAERMARTDGAKAASEAAKIEDASLREETLTEIKGAVRK